MEKERIYFIELLLSILGFLDSVYLTINHYFSSVLIYCPNIGPINCSTVLSSLYSAFFGIPTSILGVLFFATAIFFIVKRMDDYMMYLSFAGIGMVAFLLYAEWTIKSICLYCTLVHAITVVLFVLSTYIALSKTNSSSS